MSKLYENYLKQIAEMAKDWDDVEIRLQMKKDGFDDCYIPRKSGHPVEELYRKDDENEET